LLKHVAPAVNAFWKQVQLSAGCRVLDPKGVFGELNLGADVQLTVTIQSLESLVEVAMASLAACPSDGILKRENPFGWISSDAHKAWCETDAPVLCNQLEEIATMVQRGDAAAKRLALKCLDLPFLDDDPFANFERSELYPDFLTKSAVYLLAACAIPNQADVVKVVHQWVSRIVYVDFDVTTSMDTVGAMLEVICQLVDKNTDKRTAKQVAGHLYQQGSNLLNHYNPERNDWRISLCYENIVTLAGPSWLWKKQHFLWNRWLGWKQPLADEICDRNGPGGSDSDEHYEQWMADYMVRR
jgi:hypothetical protein